MNFFWIEAKNVCVCVWYEKKKQVRARVMCAWARKNERKSIENETENFLNMNDVL